jgi:hypothetical protein
VQERVGTLIRRFEEYKAMRKVIKLQNANTDLANSKLLFLRASSTRGLKEFSLVESLLAEQRLISSPLLLSPISQTNLLINSANAP